MPPRKTHAEFLYEMHIQQPDIEIMGVYSGARNRITVKCRHCNHIWEAMASNLLRGTGCPSCAGNLIKSPDKFIEQMVLINPNIEILGQYKNNKAPLLVRCRNCKREWEAKPDNLLQGKGCAACAGVLRSTTEIFASSIKNLGTDVKILGQYINNRTKIDCMCLNCGHSWTARPANLLRGQACPSCAQQKQSSSRKKTDEEYKAMLARENDTLELVGPYRGRHKKIDVRCKICGNEWSPEAGSLLCGTGCPSCSRTSTSFGEQFIAGAFVWALGEKAVISREKTTIGKELDIFIPEKKIALEYGAWFWHKNKVANDREKRTLAYKAGIRLITIYDAFSAEKVPFDNDCYTFKADLSREKNPVTLKHLILEVLFPLALIDQVPTEVEWQKIEKIAREKAKRKTTASFRAELHNINPNVIVTGHYTRDADHIEACCKKCHHIWSPSASSLLQGHGCPSCAGVRHKTPQEFAEELSVINPNILILGRFKTTRDKILVKCKTCNHEWQANAGNLLRAHGCPLCSAAKCSRNLSKEPSQFKSKLAKISPHIKIEGTYTNSKTKIEARCTHHNLNFQARPGDLLRGGGCSECKKERIRIANRKTNAQFVKEFSNTGNCNVELIGPYINSKTKINVKCKTCKHEWALRPDHLLHGHGCPKCSREHAN